MAEIITYLIVSGGLGFFNLYIAQESDLLYFGKYNKEERLAWLSIYSIINFGFLKLIMFIFNSLSTINFGFEISILYLILVLVLNLVITLLLPIIVNWLIKIIRKFLKKEPRTYLPPTNSFFEEIDQYYLYAFSFSGELVNAGTILQGTEERQSDLMLIMRPTLPSDKKNYYEFLNEALTMAQNGKIKIRELTDYTNKIHFVKIQEK